MLKDQVTLDEVIDLLNEIHAADPKAMLQLIEGRIPCNEKLAEHPTVQCLTVGGVNMVGILGVINGIFGVNERGVGGIAALFNSSGELTGFIKTRPDSL